jgi:hypothetical protein
MKYKLEVIIFKTKLKVRKIRNRIYWICDCVLDLKKYSYKDWITKERKEYHEYKTKV